MMDKDEANYIDEILDRTDKELRECEKKLNYLRCSTILFRRANAEGKHLQHVSFYSGVLAGGSERIEDSCNDVFEMVKRGMDSIQASEKKELKDD